ncbi:Imm41 family immunity protein [Paenibacillus sp. ALJ109b]|uniref:Imm41 family immunity protein n=1 Tax=Paenibacillus sp. ALJ109b TaxID=2709068 RepID=UPI0013D3111A|nr:Imm41 family immunity protein [Paenibacillus sp. ALJ109b]NEU61931.1 hypothetical protein [Paenibacillus sp. ALJ109b]
MEQSLQELLRNARAEENTFLYMLHEEARVDQLLFWKYVNSIVELTRLTANQPLDREMASAVSFTYSKIMEHLQWHHSDRDVYEIQQFPYEYANLMVDRLGRVVDGFLRASCWKKRDLTRSFLIRPPQGKWQKNNQPFYSWVIINKIRMCTRSVSERKMGRTELF